MRDLRHRAAALNAASANALIHKYLPGILGKLTVQQIAKLQRVLDAAVINDAIQKEYKDVYRRSIVAKSGGLVVRDPNMVHKADHLADSMIRLTDDDRRIRLSPELLMTIDALKPRTTNPDEAKYLVAVLGKLHAKGVWLRITQPYVRNPGDQSQHMIDPRQFELWLSLGPDGDQMPTLDGTITRDVLLGTTEIGAGYYRSVFDGNVEYSIKKLRNQLEAQIETGREEHDRLIRRKRNAGAVGTISDWFGDADLPSEDVWKKPVDLIHKSIRANTNGNPQACYAYMIGASLSIRAISKMLTDYARRSSEGAGEAIQILTVLKTAGEVAEKLLLIYDVTGLAVRGGMALSAKLAARSAAKKGTREVAAGSVDDAAKKVLDEYLEVNPGLADDLGNVTVVPGPKGSIGGGIKPGSNAGMGGRPQF